MSHSAELNLRYALRALRRRLWIVCLCVVLVPAAAVAYSLLQKPEYTAKATLLFRDPQFDQRLFGDTFMQTPIDPAREAATNVGLVSLPRVAAQTAAQLPPMTEDEVSSAVTVKNAGQSDLATIEATARTPALAARLANTFADQYI